MTDKEQFLQMLTGAGIGYTDSASESHASMHSVIAVEDDDTNASVYFTFDPGGSLLRVEIDEVA
jgi:hypothetical protein